MQLAIQKQMASLSKIHHIVTLIHLSLLLSAKQCLLHRYLLGVSLLQMRQLIPRILSVNAVVVWTWKLCCMSKIFIEIFCQRLKIHEINDLQKFCTIRYILEYCHLIGQNRHNIGWTLYVLIANILTSASMVSVTSYSWSAVAISLPWMMLIKSQSSMPPLGCCRVLNSTSVFCKRTLSRASLQGSHWSVMSLPLFCVSHSSSASHPTVAYNLDMQQSEWSAFVWVYYWGERERAPH